MNLPSLKPLALAISYASLTAIASSSFAVSAAETETLGQYSIPAGSLSVALNRFAQQTGESVVMNDSQLHNLTSQGLQGLFNTAQGFAELLKGSGLQARKIAAGYIIEAIPASQNDDVMMLDPVQIEGTRIANADEGRFGDAPAEPGGFKAEYQTTSSKMAMSLKETPQAISVVTRDSMDARQVRDIPSAIELTTGVSTTGDGGGVQNAPGAFAGRGQYEQLYMIRGQYGETRSDGFRLGIVDPDLTAYERVEVVKGPAGFYGKGAAGGFINLVRKKPQAEFAASLSGQVGSYDIYRTDFDITGALTENKNIRGRLNMAYEDSGAFTDDIESGRVVFAPSIEALIGENTRALLQILYQKDSFDTNPGMPLNLVGNKIEAYDIFSSRTDLYGSTGDKSTAEVFDVSLKLDHELSDRWLATVYLQSSKTKRDIIEGNGTSVYYGYLYKTYAKDDRMHDRWAGDVRIEGEVTAFDLDHRVLFGATIDDMSRVRTGGFHYANIGDPETFTGSLSDYRFYSRDETPTEWYNTSGTKSKAIYAQTVLSLHERTKLLISGRYDWVEQESTSTFGGDSATDSKAFTKRIGLTQELTNNISAYALYSESFDPVSNIGRNGLLDPKKGEAYELGLKTDWFDNRLGATLSVYRQDLTNRPIADPTDRTGTYSVSAGLHRTEGIELEIGGTPYPGLTIAAAAAWMNNEYTEDGDPNQGLSNNGSVDRQFSLYAAYEIQSGNWQGLGIGATFISVGERQYMINSAQAYLEGYERVDLNLSYRGIPDFDIALQVRNVTDEKYIEAASSELYQGNYYGSPRAALLNIKYHFN